MTNPDSIDELKKEVDNNKADVIISDMSPEISGNYSVDQARSIFLGEQAFKTVESLLRPGGNFICKVFSGEDLKDFIGLIKKHFNSVNLFSPKASRKSSSEIYIIAKSFKKKF